MTTNTLDMTTAIIVTLFIATVVTCLSLASYEVLMLVGG